MPGARQRWLITALVPVALSSSLVACGDDEPQARESASPATLACGSEDGSGDVISSLEVEVLSQDQARATYVLKRDVEVGILVNRHELGGAAPRLRLVGRVPFGPQRSTVVNEETFDLPKSDGQPLAAGEYEFTLRAFEAGKLNQGDPVDKRSACVTIE